MKNELGGNRKTDVLNGTFLKIPHVDFQGMRRVCEEYADMAWPVVLQKNDREVIVVAEAALGELLNYNGAEQLAEVIAVLSNQLENVLPQEASIQVQQVISGNSIAVFTQAVTGEYVPIRYVTLYPYATIPGFMEAGTGTSIPFGARNNYSREGGKVQEEFPGVGTVLYRAVSQTARRKGVGIIGTTTGNAALVASLNAGFIAAPRELVNFFTARHDGWNEVCAPCSAHKIRANEHAHCNRCADKFHHAFARGPLGVNSLAQVSEAEYISACVWRYFIPETHPRYGELMPLLTARAFSKEFIETLIEGKNIHAAHLV